MDRSESDRSIDHENELSLEEINASQLLQELDLSRIEDLEPHHPFNHEEISQVELTPHADRANYDENGMFLHPFLHRLGFETFQQYLIWKGQSNAPIKDIV